MAARVLRRWLEAPSSARGFRAIWGICGIFVPSIRGKLRTTQSLCGRFKASVRCRLPRCYCPGALDRGDLMDIFRFLLNTRWCESRMNGEMPSHCYHCHPNPGNHRLQCKCPQDSPLIRESALYKKRPSTIPL